MRELPDMDLRGMMPLSTAIAVGYSSSDLRIDVNVVIKCVQYHQYVPIQTLPDMSHLYPETKSPTALGITTQSCNPERVGRC